ncbi:MAG: hypothetical protein IKP83_04640 [Bacteroidales bacterium]|nr:hypothetical protein [Bacteroidales bacterium]
MGFRFRKQFNYLNIKYKLLKTLAMAAAISSFVCGGFAAGQNAHYVISGLPTTKSIVREYQENRFVVFNNGSAGPSFNLVDLNSMTAESFDMGPVDIMDFEIDNDAVYYCGVVGTQVLVGWFDIPTAFAGSSPVYFGYLPPMTCPQYTGTDYFTGVRKIELMATPGGLHLLVVGEGYCTSDPTHVNRFVADVYYDGSSWQVEATQEHSGIAYYDDVAVTDNYVIPITHKNQSNGEYVFLLPRPTVAYWGLFSSISPSPISNYPVRAYAGFSCHIIDMQSEITIEHIVGDVFATAYFGKYLPSGGGGYYQGTILNIYDGSNVVVNRHRVAPFGLCYNDFRYNPHTNSLYLLPDPSSAAIPDEYIELFLDATYTSVTSAQRRSDLWVTDHYSLDACVHTHPFGQAIISGNYKDLSLWRHDPSAEGSCSKSKEIKVDTVNCNMWGDFQMDIYYSQDAVNIGAYYPTLDTLEVNPICEEGKKEE